MIFIEVHQTRSYYFSQSEGPLGAYLQILSVFSCVYTEERIESCHTTIKPRSMECCSGVCPSVDFSHLYIRSWSSTRVTIRFLVTTLTKALLHPSGCCTLVVVEERPPHMIVKRFGCTTIHNKALYKCFIHSFIRSLIIDS